MRVGKVNLCVYCMNYINSGDVCPSCGKSQSNYKKKPRHLLPGTVLAKRYILGSVIGEGSFGITYMGYDRILHQRLAIKEFYPVDLVGRNFIRGSEGKEIELYSEEEREEYEKRLNKFYIEAQHLSRFSELNAIVSVRDFFRQNGTAYLVMGYVEGKSLKTVIKEQGTMDEKTVLELMKPVLESLSEIHENGIIHRDISPDNLILNKHGRLILIDFGSARVDTSKVMHTMTVVFKQGFSPVELYRSHAKQGAYSDIYALCATMYYMLFGTVPESAVERMISDELPAQLRKEKHLISTGFRRVLEKGMSIEAEKRYASIAELLSELYKSEKEAAVLKTDSFKRRKFVFLTGSVIIILFVCGSLFGRSILGSEKQAAERPGAISDVQMTKEPVKAEEPKVIQTIQPTSSAAVQESKEKKGQAATKKPEKLKKTAKKKVTPRPVQTKRPVVTEKPVERAVSTEKKTVKKHQKSKKETDDFVGTIR